MNKKLSCFIALIITATLLISLPKTMPTAASPATRIYVVPPNIRYTIDNGTVGTLFNVSVWVEDVTDLCGYQVQIRFNQSILDCLDAYEPTWDPNYVLYSILPFTMSTESDKVGQYTIGGSELPGKPQAHFNGTGLITIFKFNITAAPGEGEVLSCLLNINHDQTFLLNSVGATISATKENGYYEFRGRELPPPPPGGAKLFIDPPEIIDPTMRPSMTFFINVTIDDVASMRTCEFNLSYNTEVLGWMTVGILRVQGEVPRASMDANDDAGYIWVKLVYPIDVTTNDTTPLVRIEFHVESMGSSPLDLHDTELLDQYGRPIEHTAEDGFFMTQIRDVAILNVVPAQNWTYQNRLLNISVVAANLGNVDETLEVKLYYDTNIIGTATFNLTAYTEITLVFTWNTSLIQPCHNYTMSANVTAVPYELNLANNNFVDGKVKVYYLGDLNRDGIVNMEDIYAIIIAFLAEPGDPRWNPQADIVQDNIINMMDIYQAVINFQKSCP